MLTDVGRKTMVKLTLTLKLIFYFQSSENKWIMTRKMEYPHSSRLILKIYNKIKYVVCPRYELLIRLLFLLAYYFYISLSLMNHMLVSLCNYKIYLYLFLLIKGLRYLLYVFFIPYKEGMSTPRLINFIITWYT